MPFAVGGFEGIIVLLLGMLIFMGGILLFWEVINLGFGTLFFWFVSKKFGFIKKDLKTAFFVKFLMNTVFVTLFVFYVFLHFFIAINFEFIINFAFLVVLVLYFIAGVYLVSRFYKLKHKKSFKIMGVHFAFEIILFVGFILALSLLTSLGIQGITKIFQPELPIVPENCTDSDGGKNYFAKGTLNSLYTDYCQYENRLIEYNCDPVDYPSIAYNCKLGCIDGACKR